MSIELTPQDRQRFSLHMTEEELAALSPAELRTYRAVQEANVFGHDHKKDAQGRPIEQGIGSPGNENINHVRALEAQKSGREINEAILASVRRGAE